MRVKPASDLVVGTGQRIRNREIRAVLEEKEGVGHKKLIYRKKYGTRVSSNVY